MSNRNPINWPRAITSYLLVLVALIGIDIAFEWLFPNMHPVVDFLVGVGFAGVGLIVVLPLFRPWYRPTPVEQGGRA